MSRRHNRKGRSKSGHPFTQLFHHVQDGPAWRALSPLARSAWLEVARRYNGSNNGMIAISTSYLAERLNKSQATAWRGLRELVESGFLEVVKPGYWKPGDHFREATEYRLTCRRCDVTKSPPSRAFLKNSFPVSKSPDPGFTHETGRYDNTAPAFAHETGKPENDDRPGFMGEMHIDIYHTARRAKG